jgi:hypothetical protein
MTIDSRRRRPAVPQLLVLGLCLLIPRSGNATGYLWDLSRGSLVATADSVGAMLLDALPWQAVIACVPKRPPGAAGRAQREFALSARFRVSQGGCELIAHEARRSAIDPACIRKVLRDVTVETMKPQEGTISLAVLPAVTVKSRPKVRIASASGRHPQAHDLRQFSTWSAEACVRRRSLRYGIYRMRAYTKDRNLVAATLVDSKGRAFDAATCRQQPDSEARRINRASSSDLTTLTLYVIGEFITVDPRSHEAVREATPSRVAEQAFHARVAPLRFGHLLVAFSDSAAGHALAQVFPWQKVSRCIDKRALIHPAPKERTRKGYVVLLQARHGRFSVESPAKRPPDKTPRRLFGPPSYTRYQNESIASKGIDRRCLVRALRQTRVDRPVDGRVVIGLTVVPKAPKALALEDVEVASLEGTHAYDFARTVEYVPCFDLPGSRTDHWTVEIGVKGELLESVAVFAGKSDSMKATQCLRKRMVGLSWARVGGSQLSSKGSQIVSRYRLRARYGFPMGATRAENIAQAARGEASSLTDSLRPLVEPPTGPSKGRGLAL